MNRIAFLFTKVPHGSSSGREGLDAVLATSVLNKDIGIFFIGDGVLQLNSNQQPKHILAHNYITAFGILNLYDIKQCYVCKKSLLARGQKLITNSVFGIIRAKVLNAFMLRQKILSYHYIIRF